MTQQAIEPVPYIWVDGRLVPWESANVHLTAHVLHYGYGAYEGIRCYRTDDGRSAIFRLDAHIRRLLDSAKILTIPVSFDMAQLRKACFDVVRQNGLDGGAYIRPLVFVGTGALGFGSQNPTVVAVIAWFWGAYLGEEGIKNGIRAKVSSFLRHHVDVAAVKAKVIGQYTNAILAKREVTAMGHDEAILLDVDGYVTEASGQNLFVVRDNVVKTAPLSSSILPGITRETVIQLCREAGLAVVEERFPRDEMYIADEVFLTGTASEVTPVREIDHRVIGAGRPGEVTRLMQKTYDDLVHGRFESHRTWLDFVP